MNNYITTTDNLIVDLYTAVDNYRSGLLKEVDALYRPHASDLPIHVQFVLANLHNATDNAISVLVEELQRNADTVDIQDVNSLMPYTNDNVTEPLY